MVKTERVGFGLMGGEIALSLAFFFYESEEGFWQSRNPLGVNRRVSVRLLRFRERVEKGFEFPGIDVADGCELEMGCRCGAKAEARAGGHGRR